jgi:O-antigen/teichoic acid export membrane protein
LNCSAADVPSPDIFSTAGCQPKLIARNVASRYAALLLDTAIGFVLLPFNLTHLGAAAYGVWMLAGSVTAHFSFLDLGFGSAFVRFVAQYRARRDARALNEVASTLFFVFAGVGCAAYAIAALVAFNLDSLFRITGAQAEIGKWILLVVGVQVACNFPFSVYGGVVNGFQRYDVNARVAIVSSVTIAVVNVAVLSAGFGLITLVSATTAARILFYFVYRLNAHQIYPALEIRPGLFRRGRLREVMGFSVYSFLLDTGHRLNYQLDQIVIGTFLGATPVAVWGPGARIATATQKLTNQLNATLFPVVVDSDAGQRAERLRAILLQGTRLSLAMVVPVAVTLVAVAEPLIHVWISARVPEMRGAIPVLQILAVATAIRVGAGSATTLLKGANRHRLLAAASIGTGISNVALSIALVQPLGLPGVALGTLIPLVCSTGVIVFPAACRRVGVPLRTLIGQSIVPALWPAVAVAAFHALWPITAGRPLIGIALQSVLGGALYIALFVGLAIGRRDRALYLSTARTLVSGFGRAPAPASKSTLHV